MFTEDLASRVARLEEARKAQIERRETDVEEFAEADAANVECTETALAEIDRSLTASGF